MATTEQKAAIVTALREALSVENVYTPEPRSSYGDFACHECGERTSSERAGCVNGDCWIESAEILFWHLTGQRRPT